jgi:Bacterial Ig-like domain (group 2)
MYRNLTIGSLQQSVCMLMTVLLTMGMMVYGPIPSVSAAPHPCVDMSDAATDTIFPADPGLAQTFIAKQTTEITALETEFMNPSTSSQVDIEILKLSSDDLSTGTVIGKANVEVKGNSGFEAKKVNFSPSIPIIAGQKYAVKMKAAGMVLVKVSSDVYAEGSFYKDEAGKWSVQQDRDMSVGLYTSHAAVPMNTGAIAAQPITDRTAPSTTFSPMRLPNGAVTVTLNATDAQTGVKETYYQIDQGIVQTGNTVEFESDGSFVLKAWSEDNAGNLEQVQTTQVKVDLTTPYFTANHPRIGQVGKNTAEVFVKTNKSGKVYYTVATNTAELSAEQVKAGTDASGQLLAANLRGNVALQGNVEGKINLTGLQGSTKYCVYLVTEDPQSNLLGSVKALSFHTLPLATTPVERVGLNYSQYKILEGDRGVALRATITPANATNQQVRWSSSDSDIASVDQSGFVSPVSPGRAIITATTLDGSKSASSKITVEKKKDYTLMELEASRSRIVLKPGQSADFSVYAIFADERRENITRDKETSYMSFSPSIASVNSGRIIAGNQEGETSIEVGYDDKSVTIDVEVTSTNEVKRLIASKSSDKMQPGDSRSVKLTALYNDGTKQDVTGRADWSTSNSKVVDCEDGTISAIGPGTATVHAEFEGKTVTIHVEVIE